MTTLDPLTARLSHLFQRVDASEPTDAVLRAAANFWSEKRLGQVMPTHNDMKAVPAFVLPHVFYAHLAINGDAHWLISVAGSSARLTLRLEGHEPQESPDKRMAVRLRALCDLVTGRGEPYAVMFELEDEEGRKLMAEMYAAPLMGPEPADKQVFGVINSRLEGGG